MYAIVDIETTGGYASAHGITEISVFVHNGERVIKHFETLVNPQQPIPRYIEALTGINNQWLPTHRYLMRSRKHCTIFAAEYLYSTQCKL